MRYDATSATRSRRTGWSSGSARPRRWPGSTWPRGPAACSGSSGRTGRARPPRSASSPRCCGPTAGRPAVCGYDVLRDAHQVRQLIGLTGQYASVDEGLSGTNNLIMIGRLLGLPRAQARARAAELLARFELTDAAGAAGQDLLGRHAPPPRPGGQPGRPAAGALPRRADHRARPAQPQRGLGHDPRARRGRHHGAAHHAVPGGGRPARARHRGHRPRQGHRDRDAGRAQGQRRAARCSRSRPPSRPDWARSPRCSRR